jgi:hypothetical protein
MVRASASEPSPPTDTLFFRHPAWTIPCYLALGVFCAGATYRFAGIPGIWWSPKGLLFEGLAVGGIFFFCWLAGHLWWTATDLTLTASSLIAVHRLRLCRVELPLASVIRVRKTRTWVGLTLSRIEAGDGRAIKVGVHLKDYARFMKELQARAVNCQEFDPYLNEFDPYRRKKKP